ncbi:hypothetical protein D3C84_440410 [compost metagenome]
MANDDTATAVEAGGLNNTQPGVNPSGNVISNNDSDLEGGALHIAAIRTGPSNGSGVAGTVGGALRGLYGVLTLNADGSWSYVVDNNLAAVQALRISGQTLVDVFTYTLADVFGAADTAQLLITIDGRNDTPHAQDDNSVAVEAGGVANGTPGSNALGNVLANDSDVDSVANGESKQVQSVSSESGLTVAAGQVLVGRYGNLTLNADGSYSYAIDNSNPTVQALRTAGNTLSETFTYRMRDTAGATADARLTVVIQGADDAPVAQNDSAVASDQVAAPQTSGNVLPNDNDVDGGDGLRVVGIRVGTENGSGTQGTVGQALQGLYGTLIINADGSYTYSIDLTNPQVLAAAGLGQVLRDVFTYTISDIAGATDQAELVIILDIAEPFIPAPNDDPFFNRGRGDSFTRLPIPDVQPAVFIGPVVEREARLSEISSWRASGTQLYLARAMPFQSDSIGAGLGEVPGQFVSQAVQRSQAASDLDLAWILGRQGRTSLSADGLLSDPSLFTTDPAHMTLGPAQPEPAREARTARGFTAQLHAAAQRLYPQGRNQPE